MKNVVIEPLLPKLTTAEEAFNAGLKLLEIGNTQTNMKFEINWLVYVKKLVYSRKVREWCKIPYEGHPNGCPNYNTKEKCPNLSPYITTIINMNEPMWFVFSEFNLKEHMQKMKEKHPHWTERQCRNVLYWQNTSRKQMKDRVKLVLKAINPTPDVVLWMPESHGVNIYATMKLAGVTMDKIRDMTICRHTTLIGYKRRNESDGCF